MFRETYTFDDVALVPKYSNVLSREIPDLSTVLTKDLKMDLPILSANMDTVIGEELAMVLIHNGIIPIFHRFQDISIQKELVKKFSGKCFVSCGLKDLDSTIELFDLGALGVCIDIAHGHSVMMIQTIKTLKLMRPNIRIIAGNVCTEEATYDLIFAGADAIKVGVGPGSACTTRIQTGFGVPQFTAIMDCCKIAHRFKIPVIADGGIVLPRDFVLSLAAGASSVMMGNLFAKTYESATKKIIENDKVYGIYRGQASKQFQEDYYGSLKKGTVPEGVQYKIECTESAQDLINRLTGALKSAMTYGGSTTLKEFRDKAEIVKVHNGSYMKESLPRPEQKNHI